MGLCISQFQLRPEDGRRDGEDGGRAAFALFFRPQPGGFDSSTEQYEFQVPLSEGNKINKNLKNHIH